MFHRKRNSCRNERLYFEYYFVKDRDGNERECKKYTENLEAGGREMVDGFTFFKLARP